MSVYITSHVWHFSQLRGTALLLVLALADQANDEGYAWPSVATLAHKTRLSERTVQNLMPDIIDSGEVSLVSDASGGHTPKVYRVIAPAPPNRPPTYNRSAVRSPHPNSFPQKRGAVFTPLPEPSPVGVQNSASRGAESDVGVQKNAPGVQSTTSRGEARCTQTVLNRREPSLEPCTEPSRVRAREIFNRCPSCGREVDRKGYGHRNDRPPNNCALYGKSPGSRSWLTYATAHAARASP